MNQIFSKKSITLSLHIILFTFCSILLIGCEKLPSDTPITLTQFHLNTIVTITIYDSQNTELLNECMKICEKYESIFSRTLETSELFQLNQRLLPPTDDAHTYTLSPPLTELAMKGLFYSELSKGNFDITIAPLSQLWDFTAAEPTLPNRDLIAESLTAINYQNISINDNLIKMPTSDISLDLGGIAKGYIADKIKDYLITQGVESAMINLGGNVLCLGAKPDSSDFTIGVQKPFAGRNETIATMKISDKSVVSSGIYERYFEKDGILYHHLLNPRTGYPYENDLISVTIISSASVDGDGLSTTCFALGLEEGMALVENLDDVDAIFITKDYEFHFSSDFKERYQVDLP